MLLFNNLLDEKLPVLLKELLHIFIFIIPNKFIGFSHVKATPSVEPLKPNKSIRFLDKL